MNTERPTPRTDEAQFGTGRVSVDFARTLERELASAWEIIHQHQDTIANQMQWLAQQKQELAEAREELAAMRDELEEMRRSAKGMV